MKKDLTNRNDVTVLVKEFYLKILQDKVLSKYFAQTVENWDYHMERFVDYWESQIFFTDSYQGSPLRGELHKQVDQAHGNTFEKGHFTRWTSLFHETVDQYFAGEKAEWAKELAVNVSRNIHMKMFLGRSSGGGCPMHQKRQVGDSSATY